MRKLRLGINFTVFALFFGVAMLEAFQSGSWVRTLLWIGGAILFVAMDNLKSGDTNP